MILAFRKRMVRTPFPSHSFNFQPLFRLFFMSRFLVTVSVSFCCITKYAKAPWLKTVTICLDHDSKCQLLGLSSTLWYFCLSQQGSLMGLRATGWLIYDSLDWMAKVSDLYMVYFLPVG